MANVCKFEDRPPTFGKSMLDAVPHHDAAHKSDCHLYRRPHDLDRRLFRQNPWISVSLNTKQFSVLPDFPLIFLIASYIFLCRASDAHILFSYSLENDSSVQVEALLYLEPLKRVACALSNGRLFLVNSENIPSTPTAAEGTFVMTELGSSSIIYCLCAVFYEDKQ